MLCAKKKIGDVMGASGIWEPYFKPTARVHSSGFRCFECGYLQIGDKNKAVKKVVIATGVDHYEFRVVREATRNSP